ncbi:hypothetical protein E3A20_17420, partial [Planctomyces bekefii]
MTLPPHPTAPGAARTDPEADQAKIVETLRRVLKSHKITYRAVAGHLGVSEQTVKRL